MASASGVWQPSWHKHNSALNSFNQNLGEVLGSLVDLGNNLKTTGSDTQKQAALTACKELIILQQAVEANQRSLQVVQQRYQHSDEETNFQAQLAEYAEAAQQRVRVPPEEAQAYQDFAESMQEPEQQQEEDEDMQVADGEEEYAQNRTCPITSKQVLDLESPVEDKQGYVYEEKAIKQYIRVEGGGQCRCPQAGTNHFVKASDLRPARKVAAARRRRAILESAGTSRNADAVDI